VTVPILNDSTYEQQEILQVQLSGTLPTGVQLGKAVGIGTIIDDESYVPDLAASITTKGRLLGGGDAVSSAFEQADDKDWFKVTLLPGHSYEFGASSEVKGLTTTSAALRLRDDQGNLLSGQTTVSSNGTKLIAEAIRYGVTGIQPIDAYLEADGKALSGVGYKVTMVDTTAPPPEVSITTARTVVEGLDKFVEI